MKRLLSIILTLVLCISLFSCNDTWSKDGASDELTIDSSENEISVDSSENDSYPEGPALYKVSDDKGNVAWLFGSIHIGKEEYYPLPDYVLNAFNGSDALAVEFDVVSAQEDMAAMTSCVQLMIYYDGTTIKDHVSEELYDETVSILTKKGLYNEILDYYKPSFIESLITELAYEKYDISMDNGVDVHLIEKAKDASKTIIDIESMEFQYTLLSSFSDGIQELMLESAVNMYNTGEGIDETKELLNAWNEGDVDKILQLLQEAGDLESEEERKLYEEYNKALVIDRNISMADFAENSLKSGEEVFICVGTAHIIGEDAMIDILIERGYDVERVSA